MSDNDLIRRGDALKAMHSHDWQKTYDAIAAIPAVTAPQGVDAPDKDAPRHLVEYTNYRGETAKRVIVPIRFWWGYTEWHPHDQWMLHAWDVEKEAYRDFAWQDMRPIQNRATSSAAQAALAPAQPALEQKRCGKCNGRGYIQWHPYWDNGNDPCDACNGKGSA